MAWKPGVIGLLAVTASFHVALAQDAETIVAQYAGSSTQLAAAVADAVSADAQAAGDFCRAADDAASSTQISVGAGLAEAHRAYLEANDGVNAGIVAQIACTCELTAGDIAESFAANSGASVSQACEAPYNGEWAGVTPTLFRINAGGGGGGVSRN